MTIYVEKITDDKKVVGITKSAKLASEMGFKYSFEEHEVEQSYNGSWYIKGYAPEEPLDNLKSSKKQEINQAREQARLNEGAEYANDLFDIDEVSQSNILAKVVIARIMPTSSFIYRSKTNKNHEFSSDEIINLGLVIGAKVDEIYKKSWALKALVDNAKTKEEVDAITW